MESKGKGMYEWTSLNRRNVLKLLVGGGVGIGLSPLPWMLTDDIAIWTQNWPWVPVPESGEFSHVNTVCTLCPGGCGIQVRKVNGRAVKIEGRQDYPVNPSGICPLGAGGLQLVYGENIRFPGLMKRIGPRGTDKFTEISWEEALKEVAGYLGHLRQQGRPEAMVVVDGNPDKSTTSFLIKRFAQAFGSPNYSRIAAEEDTHGIANYLMTGNRGPIAYDLENADFILSFGCGLIEGWGAPGRVFHAWGLWHSTPLKGKVKIVQIESRASNTASKADRWLTPFPGTEAALALGIAHVLIKESLFDTGFISQHTFGFQDWTSADGKEHMGFKSLVLKKYAPAEVSKITGIHADDIVSLARSFAQAKSPIALCGKGNSCYNGNLFEFLAVYSLNALVGNIHKQGGVLHTDAIPLSPWPEIDKDAIALEGLKRPRIDQAGSEKFPFSHSLMNRLGPKIMEGSLSPEGTLLIFASNPAYQIPDGGAFNSALKRIPLKIVSFSPYKDETAMMADLILPDHSYLEKREDIVGPPGLQYPIYALTQPVIEPLYHTRATGDVIIQLAREMGGAISSSFPWENCEEAIKVRAKGLYQSGLGLSRYHPSIPPWKNTEDSKAGTKEYASFDEMWENFLSGGFWFSPSRDSGLREGVFKSPSGKFEFFMTRLTTTVQDLAKGGPMPPLLREMGIGVEGDEAFLPHYESGPPSSLNDPFPYILVPYHLINIPAGWIPSPPYLYKTLFDDQLSKKEIFVEINPKTASDLGVRQGDHVVIQSKKGSLAARANLFEGAMPGILFLPFGMGHTAYDDYQRGKGVNVNEIMDEGIDPLSGHSTWWMTKVRLKKV